MSTIYIYLYENKTNGKNYVGQTINPQKRYYEHLYGRKNKRNQLIDLAIKKYNITNFEYRIIDKCYSQEEADDKEKYYISMYNSLKPNGYNILLGGRKQKGAWNQKTIEVYDLNANKIGEYASCCEFSRMFPKYLDKSMRDCCSGKTKRYKDIIVKYKMDSRIIKPYRKPESKRKVEVYQYDLNGIFIKKYNSIDSASKETNTSRTSILGCLKGYYKTANKYIWLRENQLNEINEKVLKIPRKGKRIAQCDANMNVINIFENCREACRKLNMPLKNYKVIWKYIDKNIKVYGYYWKSQ